MKKLILTLIVLGAFILLFYLFFWIVLALAIASPFAYVWWKRRAKKERVRADRKANAVDVDRFKQIR
jgi:predicted membrane protein